MDFPRSAEGKCGSVGEIGGSVEVSGDEVEGFRLPSKESDAQPKDRKLRGRENIVPRKSGDGAGTVAEVKQPHGRDVMPPINTR